jgi:hypothetical protein
MIQKIKNFIHKHENLEKIVLFIWGIFCILRVKLIFRKIEHPETKKNFKIIILGVRTLPTTGLVYFDAIFAHAFKKLGCKAKIVYCDGVLNSCDAKTVFRNQNPQCFACKKLGSALKKSLNIDCISYRDHLNEKDIAEIKKIAEKLSLEQIFNYEYLGVNVGKQAVASTVRYTLFGKLDFSNQDHVHMLREKLVLAMITVKVAQGVVDKERPDAVFSLHDVYSTWGPFLDYFRTKNIDTIVYVNMTERFGHFMFKRNSRVFAIVSKSKWLEFSKASLSEKEEKEINEYFDQRFKGITQDLKLYESQFDNEKKEALKKLLEKKYSKRFVMYPNLAWDDAVEKEVSPIFDSIFSWIDTTIEFFKNKKDYQLIIKPHPAELIWEGCSKTLAEYIRERYGFLPENIILLEPDTPLRAYDLIDSNTTIGLVFNGGLGVELAFLGIPVLASANSHYRDADIVYKVESLDGYLKLLENPQPLFIFAKENVQLAKKYAYFYFFKGMIRIPFYKNDIWSKLDWKKIKDTDNLFSKDSPIIKICQRIIGREDIIAPL